MQRLSWLHNCQNVSLRHCQSHRPLLWASHTPRASISSPLGLHLHRTYAQLSPGQDNSSKNKDKSSKETPPTKTIKEEIKEQRHRDWTIIKQLLPNVWPKGDINTKGRVVIALGLLIAGKVSEFAHVQVESVEQAERRLRRHIALASQRSSPFLL